MYTFVIKWFNSEYIEYFRIIKADSVAEACNKMWGPDWAYRQTRRFEMVVRPDLVITDEEINDNGIPSGDGVLIDACGIKLSDLEDGGVVYFNFGD